MYEITEQRKDELRKLSDDEWRNVTPFEKKTCADCQFCKGHVSLWCTNDDAVNDRGTRIPGVVFCPYWLPDWARVDKKYRTVENGHVKMNFFKTLKNLWTT